MVDIPFGTTDWSSIERTEHRGDSGAAYWRTLNFGNIRVRMVEYTSGMSYSVADNAEAHRSSSPVATRLFIVDCQPMPVSPAQQSKTRRCRSAA